MHLVTRETFSESHCVYGRLGHNKQAALTLDSLAGHHMHTKSQHSLNPIILHRAPAGLSKGPRLLQGVWRLVQGVQRPG